MKKSIKSKISLLLASVMTVSSLAVAPVTSSADVYFYGDDGSGINEITGDEVTLWIGGGKSTLPNGAIVDGKTTQLYAFVDDDNGMYNVTTAKSTVWGLSTKSDGLKLSAGKFSDTAGLKDSVKISKGKLTAGKKLPTGKVYALAFTGFDKKTNADASSGGAFVEVVLKQAATAMAFSTDSDGDWSKRAVAKSVAAPINQKAKVYAMGGVKDGKTVKSDGVSTDNEYVIQVQSKEAGVVGVCAVDSDSSGDYGDSITIGQGELDEGFYIMGKKLVNNKITKASLLITSKASGKKAKLTVSVDNSVVAQGNSSGAGKDVGYTLIKADSSGANSGKPKKQSTEIAVTTKFYSAATSTGANLTDKPKIVVVSESDANDDGKFIANGKVKISATKFSGITAKFSAKPTTPNSEKIAVTTDGKNVQAVTTGEQKKAVVVIVYNANKNAAGQYVGIVRIPVEVIRTEDYK